MSNNSRRGIKGDYLWLLMSVVASRCVMEGRRYELVFPEEGRQEKKRAQKDQKSAFVKQNEEECEEAAEKKCLEMETRFSQPPPG